MATQDLAGLLCVDIRTTLFAKASCCPVCRKCFKYDCSVLCLYSASNFATSLSLSPLVSNHTLIPTVWQRWNEHNDTHSAFSTASERMFYAFKTTSVERSVIHLTVELAVLFTSDLVFMFHDEIEVAQIQYTGWGEGEHLFPAECLCCEWNTMRANGCYSAGLR